jgi:hypothetical protein
MRTKSKLDYLVQLAQISESRIHSYRILYLTALSITTAIALILLSAIIDNPSICLSVLLIYFILFLFIGNIIFTIIILGLTRKASNDAHFFYYHLKKRENLFLPSKRRYLTNLMYFREEYRKSGLKAANFNCFRTERLTDGQIRAFQIGSKFLRSQNLARILMVAPFIFIWIPVIVYLLYLLLIRC